MKQIYYPFKLIRTPDLVPGETNILQGKYFVDVDQLGGRFYNVPDDGIIYGIGIINGNDQKPVYNDDFIFWSTDYANSENNPIVLNTYWQRVLKGNVLRMELFLNTMLYSVYIRKGNKVKFKINK
jgi:hypothetical protein